MPTAETGKQGDTTFWESVSQTQGVNTENEEGTENIILVFIKLLLFTFHKHSCSSNSIFINIYQKSILKSHKPAFAGNESQICSGAACFYEQAEMEVTSFYLPDHALPRDFQ